MKLEIGIDSLCSKSRSNNKFVSSPNRLGLEKRQTYRYYGSGTHAALYSEGNGILSRW